MVLIEYSNDLLNVYKKVDSSSTALEIINLIEQIHEILVFIA